MTTDTSTRNTGWLNTILQDILQPGQTTGVAGMTLGQFARQGLAIVLSALMIMIPLGQGVALAQSAPDPQDEQSYPPPAADEGQQVPPAQPLAAPQLDQLVAPIALYPDALLGQILAAATYPTQVVEADRWRQAQGNASPEQIAAAAEAQNWDPSVKALTAFPAVLAQMDQNIQWTTDLGNAYYNQPQDVMDAVQAMRQKAQAAGQLRTTPQQVVTDSGGAITIAPANPAVVYVPVYNPWDVYGAPIAVYPGYYYAPPPGVFWGGLAIGFGIGIGVAFLAHWAWGWPHWGLGWGNHAVVFNHTTFITHSTTVINRGFNRPGGPPRYYGARGAYARSAGNPGFNRPGGNNVPRPNTAYHNPGANTGRPNMGYGNRPANNVPRPPSAGYRASNTGGYGSTNHPNAGSYRPPANYGHPGGQPSGNYSHPGGSSYSRPSGGQRASNGSSYGNYGGNYNRGGGGFSHPSAPPASMSHGSSYGGGHSSYSGGHSSGGGHSSYSAHASGGGHSGGGHSSGSHGGGHHG